MQQLALARNRNSWMVGMSLRATNNKKKTNIRLSKFSRIVAIKSCKGPFRKNVTLVGGGGGLKESHTMTQRDGGGGCHK